MWGKCRGIVKIVPILPYLLGNVFQDKCYSNKIFCWHRWSSLLPVCQSIYNITQPRHPLYFRVYNWVFFYKSGTYVLYQWVLQAGQHQRPGLCEVFPQVQVTTGSDLTSCSSSVWLSLVQNPKGYETKHQLQHVHHVSIFLIKGESAYQELPKEVSYLGDQPVQAEVLSHIQLSPWLLAYIPKLGCNPSFIFNLWSPSSPEWGRRRWGTPRRTSRGSTHLKGQKGQE